MASVVFAPSEPEWWLDAQLYRVPLPDGWTAIVGGEATPAFDLVQEPGRAVFVQTARNRPTLEALVAPGQVVVARGADDRADWVEVSYEHEGRRWQQRHALMRTRAPALITAQAPAQAFAEARALHTEIVRRALISPRADGA